MLGTIIFLTPEDIMERNKKLIFTLIAGIDYIHKKGP
jgi:hypothetical protein